MQPDDPQLFRVKKQGTESDSIPTLCPACGKKIEAGLRNSDD